MSIAVEFNDLLRAADIDPSSVCVIRHHTPEPSKVYKTIFDLWRDNPPGFTRYQGVQKPNQPRFRNRKIWAGFVSPTPGETLFIGLFDASLSDTRKVEWPCDYRGDAPGGGEPVDIFTTRLRPELAEYIGKLRVMWPERNVRTWARKAEGLRLQIESGAAVSAHPLDGEALVEGLQGLDFRLIHATKKLVQLRRGNLVIYVKRETNVRPLVVNPYFLNIARELKRFDGIDLDEPIRTYKNSNLTQFPIYFGYDRKTVGRHGLAIGVKSNRLGALVDLLEGHASIETTDGVVRLVAPEDDPLTERERLQAARIGQGDFRNALMIYWDSTCPVAGVDHSELLRASHIKSWKSSTNAERLDPFNGLLLCAHIDVLFDRHLISFEDDGRILISSAVSAENRHRLGLYPDIRIDGLDPSHSRYLAHHRRYFRV